jgi:hypothetical protein
MLVGRRPRPEADITIGGVPVLEKYRPNILTALFHLPTLAEISEFERMSGQLAVVRRPGTWQPGQSGNPRGRPPGSRNKSTIVWQQMIEGEAEGVIRSMVEAALRGNVYAGKTILDRIAPVRRDRPVTFGLPSVADAESTRSAFDAVIRALAEGEVTPEEAEAISRVLELRRRAVETTELEERIAALENRRAGGGGS